MSVVVRNLGFMKSPFVCLRRAEARSLGSVEIQVKRLDEKLGHLVASDLLLTAESVGSASGDHGARPQVVDVLAEGIRRGNVREMEVGTGGITGVGRPQRLRHAAPPPGDTIAFATSAAI